METASMHSFLVELCCKREQQHGAVAGASSGSERRIDSKTGDEACVSAGGRDPGEGAACAQVAGAVLWRKGGGMTGESQWKLPSEGGQASARAESRMGEGWAFQGSREGDPVF